MGRISIFDCEKSNGILRLALGKIAPFLKSGLGGLNLFGAETGIVFNLADDFAGAMEIAAIDGVNFGRFDPKTKILRLGGGFLLQNFNGRSQLTAAQKIVKWTPAA